MVTEVQIGSQVQTLAELMDLKDAVWTELRKSLYVKQFELLTCWSALSLAVEDAILNHDVVPGSNGQGGGLGRQTTQAIADAQRLLSKS